MAEVTAPALRQLARRQRAGAGAGLCPRRRRRQADGRLLSLRRRAAAASWPGRASSLRPPTGGAPRTNAPTASTRGCPANARSSTATSPISPKPGPKDNRVKRLAIMDSDGANHRFITNGQSTALTPRFSPDYKTIVYRQLSERLPRDLRLRHRQRPAAAGDRKPQPDFRAALLARWPLRSSIRWRSAATPTSIASRVRRRHAAAADQHARDRRRRQLSRPTAARIVFESDRSGSAADLRDERRRFEPAAHQLRRRPLRHARMEPARRSDRLHPHRAATCASG